MGTPEPCPVVESARASDAVLEEAMRFMATGRRACKRHMSSPRLRPPLLAGGFDCGRPPDEPPPSLHLGIFLVTFRVNWHGVCLYTLTHAHRVRLCTVV